MKEFLFSYGTLQKEDVQLKLFGRKLKGTKDILKGYCIVPIQITDEKFLDKGEEKNQLIAVASNDKFDSIAGTVFEMTADEILHADQYEPDNYKRIKITLTSGKEAWIYTGKTEKEC